MPTYFTDVVKDPKTPSLEDLGAKVREFFTPEELILALTPEERVAGLAPDVRLAGLTSDEIVPALPDDILRGLSDAFVAGLPEAVRAKVDGRLGR